MTFASQPTTSLDDIMPPLQQRQVVTELVRVFSRESGRVELDIEKHQLRWIRGYTRTYNPNIVAHNEITVQPLPIILGEWLHPLKTEMLDAMAGGWGKVIIGIEHSRIAYVEGCSDQRAHFGDVNNVAPVSAC